MGAISSLPINNIINPLPADFELKNGEVGARLVLGNSVKKNGNYTSFPDTTNSKEYSYDQPR